MAGPHRARLTDFEVGVLQERIEFVTRNRYVRHPQAERDKAEQASRAKTACWVNPEDLAEVFDVLGTRSQTGAAAPKWTYLRQAECWLAWVIFKFFDYVPAIRP